VDKPRNVVIAVWLLYASFAPWFFLLLSGAMKAGSQAIGAIAFVIGMFAVVALAISRVDAGSYSARIVLVSIFGLGILWMLFCWFLCLVYQGHGPTPGMLALDFIPRMLQAYALFLTFTKPAGAWFKKP
jgi:hypothetical protein